jgi:hypothetical protein
MILIVKPSGRSNGSSSQITAPWSTASWRPGRRRQPCCRGRPPARSQILGDDREAIFVLSTIARPISCTGHPARRLCLLRPGSAGDGQHRRVDPLLEVGRAADQAILARTHFPLSPVSRCPGETCVTPFRARRRAAHCNGWYQESWVCAPCVTLAPDSPRIPSRYARVPLCQPSQTSTLRNGHRSADGRCHPPAAWDQWFATT